jgi:hypothetical protein
MKKAKTITAEEFDRLADTGCSMVPYLDMSTATRPGRRGKRLGAGRKVSERDVESDRLGSDAHQEDGVRSDRGCHPKHSEPNPFQKDGMIDTLESHGRLVATGMKSEWHQPS